MEEFSWVASALIYEHDQSTKHSAMSFEHGASWAFLYYSRHIKGIFMTASLSLSCEWSFYLFRKTQVPFFRRFINPCTCDPIVWGRTIHRQISFEDFFVELLIALVRCVSTKINERFSVTVCCSWVLHTSTFNFNYVLHVMPKLPLNQYFRDP